MKRQSRVKGITISYISTAVRTLSKLFVTPIYLRVLGLDDYGFYQYIFSIASYVTILDFGITSVINTFSIKYKEDGNKEEKTEPITEEKTEVKEGENKEVKTEDNPEVKAEESKEEKTEENKEIKKEEGDNKNNEGQDADKKPE